MHAHREAERLGTGVRQDEREREGTRRQVSGGEVGAEWAREETEVAIAPAQPREERRAARAARVRAHERVRIPQEKTPAHSAFPQQRLGL